MIATPRVIKAIGISILALTGPGLFAAEPIRFTSADGKSHLLNEYLGKGKWTIAMIWASDCQICNKEAPNYEAFHNKHKDKDAVMLGISMDGKEGMKDALGFINKHKLTFTNLVGEGEDIGAMFYDMTGVNFAGTPTFLIFDPKGELKVQQIGAVPVEMIEDFLQQQSSPASKS